LAAGAEPDTTRPPNLLFLYTDEQRFDTLAAYGNRVIQMPNLNRLADQATVFERAYVTQPVCTPSRASLLTGLWPHTSGCIQNNIPLRPDTRCLPEMLPPGRYVCAHMGKWHVGDEIYPQHGFTVWEATEDTYHAYYFRGRDEFADRSAYHHWLIARGIKPWERPEAAKHQAYRNRFFRDQIHSLPEEHCRPRFLAEAACRFIRENALRPFVLYVNFLEPHMPFHSCRDNQYKPEEVTLPANFLVPLTAEHSCHARVTAARLREQGYEGPLRTEADWRRLIARYWGLCSLVDTHVGTILDTLAECKLENDTIIVFTSDHGDMMGSHGLLAKGFMFEESARVPLVIRLPGQRAGRHVAAPISHIDIVPTLLDLMGVPAPSHLQGKSRRAVLEGREKMPPDDVFIEWNVLPTKSERKPSALPKYAEGICSAEQAAASARAELRAIATPDLWKFTWSSVGEHELYDLNTDPGELRNLARKPEHAARVRELTNRIRGWQQRTGDKLSITLPP
jgi:arylsulfatase A-like enzyme